MENTINLKRSAIWSSNNDVSQFYFFILIKFTKSTINNCLFSLPGPFSQRRVDIIEKNEKDMDMESIE